MARYQIWDKTSNIYTLVGEVLTPEQWIDRYSWANIPGVKMIIGGGAINGTVAMEFDTTKEMYEKMGCDFSACETDQEVLDAIEAFEDDPPVSDEPSTEERTAAALEFLALSSLPDEEITA